MNEEFEWAKRMLGQVTSQKAVHTYHGQESAMAQLLPFINRPEPMPPVLLTGEPGIGKTRLGMFIATQRGEHFELLGPVQDLSGFPIPPAVALVDEIHGIRNPEFMYSLLERRRLTIIGATDRPQRMNAAFKSRFAIQIPLRPLSEEALAKVIRDEIPDADEEAIGLFAGAAAGNPRQALRIAETAKVLGVDDPESVLATCRITADGITEFQIEYLKRLSGSPIGVSQLATLLYVDEDTVRNAERFLIEKGLVMLTTSGRRLSPKGRAYVDHT